MNPLYPTSVDPRTSKKPRTSGQNGGLHGLAQVSAVLPFVTLGDSRFALGLCVQLPGRCLLLPWERTARAHVGQEGQSSRVTHAARRQSCCDFLRFPDVLPRELTSSLPLHTSSRSLPRKQGHLQRWKLSPWLEAPDHRETGSRGQAWISLQSPTWGAF